MEDKKKIETKKELLEVLKNIPIQSDEQKRRIICSLIGHSNICETCWGYRNCGRCGETLGDNLAGIDLGRETSVIIGHNCKECKKNYKKCSWKDKYLVKNPFTKSRKIKKK